LNSADIKWLVVMGVLWPIVGVWAVVVTWVWVGIAMCLLGVLYLGHAARRARASAT